MSEADRESEEVGHGTREASDLTELFFQALQTIVDNSLKLTLDHHLAWYAHFELGRLLVRRGGHENLVRARGHFTTIIEAKVLMGPSKGKGKVSLQSGIVLKTNAARKSSLPMTAACPAERVHYRSRRCQKAIRRDRGTLSARPLCECSHRRVSCRIHSASASNSRVFSVLAFLHRCFFESSVIMLELRRSCVLLVLLLQSSLTLGVSSVMFAEVVS